MPIIALCKETDEGARRHEENGHVYYTKLEYVGCCISDYEVNGYSDSDWYMRVWDEKDQCVKTLCFASTRGWSYPCYGSSPDATPEVLAKVEAWQAAQKAKHEAEDKAAVEKRIAELALALSIDPSKALKLMMACSDQRWKLEAVQKLFTTKLRSPFKIALRDQVGAWLREDAPKYDSPLSPRQWPTLHPMRYATVYRTGYNRDIVDSYSRPDMHREVIRRMVG